MLCKRAFDQPNLTADRLTALQPVMQALALVQIVQQVATTQFDPFAKRFLRPQQTTGTHDAFQRGTQLLEVRAAHHYKVMVLADKKFLGLVIELGMIGLRGNRALLDRPLVLPEVTP